MQQTHETEGDVMMEIESLELLAREVRHRAEAAKEGRDRRVLKRQLKELETQIDRLRRRFR